jgi:hypothetical protein
MWDLENQHWDKIISICYYYNHSRFFKLSIDQLNYDIVKGSINPENVILFSGKIKVIEVL